MIYQDDPIINNYYPLMKPNGCAILLPFWTASRFGKRLVSREFIVTKIHEWMDNGWISEELYINHWKSIHEDLGINVLYHGHVDPERGIGMNQFAYGYWYVAWGSYYHFTAVHNGNANHVTYDPLGASSVGDIGLLQTLRLFTLL